MIRTYIYHEEKNNWLEEDYLLLHDLCALLDEEESIVYLWNGPKSTVARLERGYESVVDLITNMPVENPLQLTILTEDVPPKIEKRLTALLERVKKEEQEETENFAKIQTIRAYFILGLLGIIFPIISFLNLAGSLAWPAEDGYAEISSELFEIWLGGSFILIIITLILYIGTLIISFIEKDIQILIFSISAIITCSGILGYLTQGIFLFEFGDESTSSTYYVPQAELLIFVMVQAFALLIIVLPNLYRFLKFWKTYQHYIY